MKKLVLLATLLIATSTLFAQPSPPQFPTFYGVPDFSSDQWVTTWDWQLNEVPWDESPFEYVTEHGPAITCALITESGEKSSVYIDAPNHSNAGQSVPHKLSFWYQFWRDTDDWFTLHVGGTQAPPLALSDNWKQMTYIVSAVPGETVRLEWKVSRGNSFGPASQVYLDAVRWMPIYPPTENPVSGDFRIEKRGARLVVSWNRSVYHDGYKLYGSDQLTGQYVELFFFKYVNGNRFEVYLDGPNKIWFFQLRSES